MISEKDQAELLRLVELDYDRTAKFIEGTAGTGTAIRGWAITVWVALLGVALNQKLWPVAVLGAISPLVFMAVDAYHGTIYGQALYHARRLERITAGHFARLSRGSAHPTADLDAQVLIASHKYGLYSDLREFRWSDLRRVRPTVFYQVFYPTMVGIALLIAVFLALSGLAQSPAGGGVPSSTPAVATPSPHSTSR